MNIIDEKRLDITGGTEIILLRHVNINDNEKLFVSLLSSQSSRRYTFQIINANTCIYESYDNELPPKEIIEAVQNEDWEIQNFPQISNELPDWERLNLLNEIISKIIKYDTQIDQLVEIYIQRMENIVPAALALHTLKSILTEDEYIKSLQIGINDTDGVSNYEDLKNADIETIQKVLVNTRHNIPEYANDELIDKSEERGLFGI